MYRKRRSRGQVCAFFCEKNMSTKTEIKCPKCGNKVMTYDGKSTMTLHSTCHRCRHVVAFSGLTGKTWIDKNCERSTSSGMRFY